MEINLQNNLYKKYPQLFVQKDWDKTKTRMCWGISCDDGWYDLINKTCQDLNQYIKLNKNNSIQLPQFYQIKQKFGRLRIYIDNANNEIRSMMRNIENFSSIVCEKCGSTKSVEQHGSIWIKSLCKKCINKIEKNRKK